MDFLADASSLEKRLIQGAAQRRSPVSGSLELLPLCNMDCDMCYVRLSRAQMEARGRLRTAQEWLALAGQMQRAGVLFLLLTGGEPLIYPDFRRLWVELKRMGFVLSLNTNGTLMDGQWADFFAEHRPRRVNITLYGADEAAYRELCHYPGGFERTLEGVRLLRERGVDVRVGASVTRENRGELARIAAIARELDAALNVDTYMVPATRERERPFADQARLLPEEAARARVEGERLQRPEAEFREYASAMLYAATHTPPGPDEPGQMGCLAGRCSFTVNWQGEMHPCVLLTEPSAPVFEIGFDAAWKRIAEGVAAVRLSAQCSRCRLRAVCQTCAACALYESGRLDGVPEYMCRYTVETLNALAGALGESGPAEDAR